MTADLLLHASDRLSDQIETSEVLLVRRALLQALNDGGGGGNLWQPLAPYQQPRGSSGAGKVPIISGGDEEVNQALYQLLWKPQIGVEVRIHFANKRAEVGESLLSHMAQ